MTGALLIATVTAGSSAGFYIPAFLLAGLLLLPGVWTYVHTLFSTRRHRKAPDHD